MYTVDLDRGLYMIADINADGKASHFSEVVLDGARELCRTDCFYLVALNENYMDVRVTPVKVYKAFFTTSDNSSVIDGIECGMIDPLDTANKIMESYNRSRRHLN